MVLQELLLPMMLRSSKRMKSMAVQEEDESGQHCLIGVEFCQNHRSRHWEQAMFLEGEQTKKYC